MAMGKRKPRQESLFVSTDQLAPKAGHPFYQKLNELLAEVKFDTWVESRCMLHYECEEKRGQPSVPPGVYFRMLFVGYFEGIDSQRGIAWGCADSFSLRAFLGIALDRQTPDHSTLSLTRNRLPAELFDEVFQFVLGIAAAAHNLGRILRKLTGVGKPRALQGAKDGLGGVLRNLGARWATICRRWSNQWANLFAQLRGVKTAERLFSQLETVLEKRNKSPGC